MKCVFDVESNGLLDTLSKIHCIVVQDIETQEVFQFPPDEIEQALKMLEAADEIIAHNARLECGCSNPPVWCEDDE